MRVICDLHLHSRYSLATSKSLDLRSLADGAKRVGIELLAAPDFTHPAWREEMRSDLVETQYGSGVFTTRGENFVLMSEVSCIWRQDGQSRRVHILIAAPSFEAVDKMSAKFAKLQNLESDGRPIFKISALKLFEIVRDADPSCELIPAHVFTPWYGVFGAKSGFNSLDECFGDYTDEIPAVETGLSSDPSMHWSVPDSRTRAIVSFSDAHSVASLGREATVLEVRELSYESVICALRGRDVVETYEFHPEHGKYHLDGHRKCGVRMHPDDSVEIGGVCPKCQRGMTLGVLNRTRAISDGPRFGAVKDATGLWEDPLDVHSPYRHLVPLNEILAYTLDVGKSTKRVKSAYSELMDTFGNEFSVLLSPSESEITAVTKRDDVARAIINARLGNVKLDAGYDGVFGSAIPRVIERPNEP